MVHVYKMHGDMIFREILQWNWKITSTKWVSSEEIERPRQETIYDPDVDSDWILIS